MGFMLRPKAIVEDIYSALSEYQKEYARRSPSKYPFSEWDKKREIVKRRLKRLPDAINKAVSSIRIKKKTGRPKKLNLSERTNLFLLIRTLNKSNRDSEYMVHLMKPLLGIDANYKAIERLYSDEMVQMAMHNLFVILLQDEKISGNLSGDGTGYSVMVSKHYASRINKSSKDYKYVFRVIDLDSGMYVAYGYSENSEMDAFKSAMASLSELGLQVDSISLDRYYSSKRVLKLFDTHTNVYVIPKKNIAHVTLEWYRVFKKWFADSHAFIRRYFQRNLNEAAFSSDKRRFGWIIRQVRTDRRIACANAIALLHNLFFIRVKPG
jgi:transposase